MTDGVYGWVKALVVNLKMESDLKKNSNLVRERREVGGKYFKVIIANFEQLKAGITKWWR